MSETLNYARDLGTLTRLALVRDLIAHGVLESEAIELELIERLEIRLRKWRGCSGAFSLAGAGIDSHNARPGRARSGPDGSLR